MIATIFSCGILGFKYYNSEPLPVVDFSIAGNDHLVGELISFDNQISGKHDFAWDFGDSSMVSIKRKPIHHYSKAGQYEVKLLVDGKYEVVKTVVVKERVKNKPSYLIAKIVGENSVLTGKPLNLTCSTDGAKSFQWYIDGEKGPVSTKQTINHVFDKPGFKKVTLVVNGDMAHKAVKSIYVRKPENNIVADVIQQTQRPDEEPLDKFVPDSPESYSRFDNLNAQLASVVVLPEDKELQLEFEIILRGQGDQKKFESYLCKSALDLMVVCNGELTSFANLVEEMKGIDYTLREFSTTRKDNSCITKITIKYKRKRNFLNL